jgi:hypothetical protein
METKTMSDMKHGQAGQHARRITESTHQSTASAQRPRGVAAERGPTRRLRPQHAGQPASPSETDRFERKSQEKVLIGRLDAAKNRQKHFT